MVILYDLTLLRPGIGESEFLPRAADVGRRNSNVTQGSLRVHHASRKQPIAYMLPLGNRDNLSLRLHLHRRLRLLDQALTRQCRLILRLLTAFNMVQWLTTGLDWLLSLPSTPTILPSRVLYCFGVKVWKCRPETPYFLISTASSRMCIQSAAITFFTLGVCAKDWTGRRRYSC